MPGVEQWKTSVCYGCYNACGIKVGLRNGVIVDIIGDPDNPAGKGHICAKGKARIMDVYSKDRITKPLRRRNPEKGIGVDPQWEEISWEKALSILTDKLKKARANNPKGVVLAHFDMPVAVITRAWATAFGTPHGNWSAAGLYCGMGSHAINMLIDGSFNSEIDFDLCNHAVLIGTQMGFLVDSNAMVTTRKLAEARKRGMKLTVVDPICGTAAGKSDNWLPIRPGSDAAFALAIVNLLVNEIKKYDGPFLQQHTNACYLIGEDGLYVRDKINSKPLVWNRSIDSAQAFDECPWEDAAMEGKYEYNGQTCRPAFELLREHLKQYPVDKVSEITTIPAEKIRKLAEELAEDACLGQTITVDGVELPYRPVAVNFKTGIAGHKHGMSAVMACHLINIVLGAIDVPGGFLGDNPIGPYWEPEVGPDGLLIASDTIRSLFGYNGPFPGSPVRRPETFTLQEIFPVAMLGRAMYPFVILDPQKYGLNYEIEVLLHSRVNLMMSMANPKQMEGVLTKIPFQVSFSTEIDETTEFADIILPDAHDLERDDTFPANHPFSFVAPGQMPWYWTLRKTVLKPRGEARPWAEVLIDLAHRLDMDEEFYEILNVLLGLQGEHRLRGGGKFNIAEMARRQIKGFPIAQGDPELFEKTSTWITTKGNRTVREAYPGPFLKPRFPIYIEHLITRGKEVAEIVKALGIKWDISDYQPLPAYAPPAGDVNPDPQYDLYAVTFKTPFLTFGRAPYNAWLSELAEKHPFAYRILLNSKTAKDRGISDGDWIAVESKAGRTVGQVKVTEGIQPETVAIGGIHGHWARQPKMAAGKGAHFNALVPLEVEIVDTLSSGFDSKPKVKVYKVTSSDAGERKMQP